MVRREAIEANKEDVNYAMLKLDLEFLMEKNKECG